VKVDQHKVEFEYNSLMKFHEIQSHSVPHVYFLDRPHKTSN
jgi:5-methylthioribose kinase